MGVGLFGKQKDHVVKNSQTCKKTPPPNFQPRWGIRKISNEENNFVEDLDAEPLDEEAELLDKSTFMNLKNEIGELVRIFSSSKANMTK